MRLHPKLGRCLLSVDPADEGTTALVMRLERVSDCHRTDVHVVYFYTEADAGDSSRRC